MRIWYMMRVLRDRRKADTDGEKSYEQLFFIINATKLEPGRGLLQVELWSERCFFLLRRQRLPPSSSIYQDAKLFGKRCSLFY
jgi:hypothetical protein